MSKRILNPIWNYFTLKNVVQVPKTGRFTKMVQCNICQKVLTCSSGTTTPLRNHLSVTHTADFVNYITEYNLLRVQAGGAAQAAASAPTEAGSAADDSVADQSLNETLESVSQASVDPEDAPLRAPGSGKKDQEVNTLQKTMDVTYFLSLAQTGTLFDFGESQFTQELFKNLNADWTLQSPKYYGQEVLEFVRNQMHSQMAKSMAKMVRTRRSVALTMSVKVAANGSQFVEIHHCFISDQLVFHRHLIAVLPLDRFADYDEFKDKFNGTLMDNYPSIIDEDKTVYVTCDMDTPALKHCLNETYYEAVPVPCRAKQLEMMLLCAIKDVPETLEVMAMSFQINTMLTNDNELAMRLKSLCQKNKVAYTQLEPANLGPISLDLVIGMYRMQPALRELIERDPDGKLKDKIPTAKQFLLLKELIGPIMVVQLYHADMMKPGVKIQVAESTIAEVKSQLKDYLVAIEDRTANDKSATRDDMWALQYGKMTLERMIQQHERLIKTSPDVSEVTWLAAILDPRRKGMILFDPEDRQKFLAKIIAQHPSTKNAPKQLVPFTSPYTEDELNDMDFIKRRNAQFKIKAAMLEHERAQEKAAGPPPLELELKAYMDMPEAESSTYVLDWWREKKDELPLLTELAKEILAVQFTVEGDDIPNLPASRSWTKVNSEGKTGGAKLEDLLFVQRTTLDLMKLKQKWNYKRLRKPREEACEPAQEEPKGKRGEREEGESSFEKKSKKGKASQEAKETNIEEVHSGDEHGK